jgi:Tat protein secretion system quality control protein TatD with DNase activity
MIPFLDLHTHQSTRQPNMIAIQNKVVGLDMEMEQGNFYSIGIHPWYAAGSASKLLATLEEKANQPSG